MNENIKSIINEYEKQLRIIEPETGLRDVPKFKAKYQRAIDEAVPRQRFSAGNGKLPATTAITNLGSWFNCPGRTRGYCEICDICYDKFREVMSYKVCKSRLNHELWFRSNSAGVIADAIITEIKVHDLRNPDEKINLHRWAEVGEVRNQEELYKVNEISNQIYDELGVNSYIYVHNQDLDYDFYRPHLTVNGSNFMVDNEFRVIEPEDYEEFVEAHDCFECFGDCGACHSICAKSLGILIVERLRR